MAVIFALTVPTVSASDKIYKFIDSKGVLHFTNVPVSTNFELYLKEVPTKAVKTKDPDKYKNIISIASQRYGVSVPLLQAIIKVESDFNPRAVSRAGAVGLMQIMPDNFKTLKIKDPYNPWQNIMGGSQYLQMMLKRFNGRLSLALAAYNAGPHTVDHYKKTIPPYPETERYVKKVMRYYYVYKNKT